MVIRFSLSDPLTFGNFSAVNFHCFFLSFCFIFPALCPSGKFLKNFYCVAECGPGFCGNSLTGNCEKCSSSCRTCLDGEVATKCSSCNSPFYIQGIVVKLKSGIRGVFN